MSTPLYKLRPDQTMSLLAFDGRGAAGFFTEATATSFKVHTVLRDMSDFVVLKVATLYDFFGHYTQKYLPDPDHTGMVLRFDVHYAGLQPIDSPKFNFIDWATLDTIQMNGSRPKVYLWDYATLQSGSFTAATGSITVTTPGANIFDRVTLWLNNVAFDFIAGGGETDAQVADNIRFQINTTNWPVHSPTMAVMASVSGATISLKAARYGTVNVSGTTVSWQSFDRFTAIPVGSTIYINGFSYIVASVTSAFSLQLTTSAPTLTGAYYLAERGGQDGNFIELYALNKNANLTWSAPTVKLSGGSSNVTWRVTIDFTARGIDDLHEAWFTFAPALTDGTTYTSTEGVATFTNWDVITDPGSKRQMKVAGPGSVWVGNTDAWVKYTGTWLTEAGFYWKGFARFTVVNGDSIQIAYAAPAHELYLGTVMHGDCGIVNVSLDGDTATPLDCYLDGEPAQSGRQLVRSSVAAGKHVLTITHTGTKNALSTGYKFYFDYLCAAVLGDMPAPMSDQNLAVATDLDTGHAFQLAPVRLLNDIEYLGTVNRINHYIGVFWWGQRYRVGGVFKSWTIQFGGTWAGGDTVFVSVGTFTMGKSVFPADTSSTIARHFRDFINASLVAVYAEITGTPGELVITVRTPMWSDTKNVSYTSAGGTVSETGNLSTGTMGTWEVDLTAADPINYPTRKWHEDFFNEIAARSLEVVCAFSMELIFPPANFAARYYDGTIIETDTGFGSVHSTHCTFSPAVAAYHKLCFASIAALMNSAGLPVKMQFGEYLWWFFSQRALVPLAVANSTPIEIFYSLPHTLSNGDVLVNAGYKGCTAANGTYTVTVVNANQVSLNGTVGNGAWVSGTGTTRTGSMGFYDADTTAAALVHFGRALAKFTCQDQDPDSINLGADANWLRTLIKAHVDTIRAWVLASFPTAEFEFLFAYDVNNPVCYYTPDFPYPQGGRLNARVNFPIDYLTKAGSGLDHLKMESLSWGSFYRTRDMAKITMGFPFTSPASWSPADVSYLVPVFNGGCPFPQEITDARRAGVLNVCLWARDQLILLHSEQPISKAIAEADVL